MAGTYIYFQFMYIITDWLFISIIPHLTPKNQSMKMREAFNNYELLKASLEGVFSAKH